MIVKRYFRNEAGHSRALELMATDPSQRLVSSEIVLVEFASALARRVREGALKQESARLAWRAFLGDSRGGLRLAAVGDEVISEARRLIEKYPLRTLDALHLATAHRLRRVGSQTGAEWAFVTGDRRQESAARAEGWRTELVAD